MPLVAGDRLRRCPDSTQGDRRETRPADPPTVSEIVAVMRTAGEGPHGAIHVWIPPSFHSDVGATIVYLHGYYDDADSSYIGHRLPEQFAMSALDAMFIVAETPVAAKTPINYPSLGELLQLKIPSPSKETAI